MSETIYITKYALSSNGKIETAQATKEAFDEEWYRVSGRWGGLKIGRDAYLTPEAAIAAAKAARDKKIVSLKKQIAKLEAMAFLPS